MFNALKKRLLNSLYFNLIKLKNEIAQSKLENNIKKLKKYGTLNDINRETHIICPERVEIGSYIYIGPGAYISGWGGVSIANGTIIGPNLAIHSANHNFKNSKYIPYDETFDFRKVTIGENVWIGANVIIVPGAEIGEGCIVAAGTVVSGNIPPLSIIAGNPCKVIKQRDAEHYFKLKTENLIYLKNKKEKNLIPDVHFGYSETEDLLKNSN